MNLPLTTLDLNLNLNLNLGSFSEILSVSDENPASNE
jgi:hypothetical protein